MKYFFLLFLCLSCGDDAFRKIEKLDGFRILAIQVDNPEVGIGISPVNVRPFIADVNGADATINGTYQTCIDPGIGRGADVECDSAELSYSIPMGPLTNRTGFGPQLAVNIPGNILNGRTTLEKFNGVSYLVIFRFVVNGIEHRSVKRIAVTDRSLVDLDPTLVNVNPTGTGLLVNGSPYSTSPKDGDELLVNASGAQTYKVINIDGSIESRQEEFEIAWYTSTGEFDRPKASVTQGVKYKGDTPSSVTVAIIRDERGGVDVRQSP